MSLERFITAQNAVWPAVIAELTAGAKRSHWMWFVFPQLRGLGHSEISQHYGIAGLHEARDYLADPVLGPRLEETLGLVIGHAGTKSAHDIFGSPDDMKFRSSLTLFSHATTHHNEIAGPADDDPFHRALVAFYGGKEDRLTVEMLDEQR